MGRIEEEFYANIDKRQVIENGRYIKPANVENEENPDFVYEMKEKFPTIQLPAVILPHGILGISNSQLIVDKSMGKFGPFDGQVFIGDQGQSKIMRVVLEKVKGEYQGVAFDFTDGFEVEFTKPVDRESAEDLDSYLGKSYIYKYHAVYGSPQTNLEEAKIKGVKVSDDGLKVRIVMDNMRQFYVHEFSLEGVKDADGNGILHPTFYYTLNNFQEGAKLPASDLSTKRSSAQAKPKKIVKKQISKAVVKKEEVLTDAEVGRLLTRNTCNACHQKDKRVVGPSFQAVAKRNYSNEKIVELIYNPQPKNWPEYATPMAPMPQVSRDQALKIAAWINSLK